MIKTPEAEFRFDIFTAEWRVMRNEHWRRRRGHCIDVNSRSRLGFLRPLRDTSREASVVVQKGVEIKGR